jgi:hypothetical protein
VKKVKKLVLCLIVAGAGLTLSNPPSNAVIMPNCVEFCCVPNPAIANVQCRYLSGTKICSWFWVPGRSACL